jgi:hypothetical protein
MIQSPKLMITVAWNPSGFQVVAALPMGTKFNAGFYTTEILQRIKDWRGNHGVRRVRRLVVHADNARPHTANLLMSFMEDNMMTKALHPPYSPDLASSDFFLFGGMFESPDMHISFHIPWWTSGKNVHQFIPLKPEHTGRLNGDPCLIEDY